MVLSCGWEGKYLLLLLSSFWKCQLQVLTLDFIQLAWKVLFTSFSLLIENWDNRNPYGCNSFCRLLPLVPHIVDAAEVRKYIADWYGWHFYIADILIYSWWLLIYINPDKASFCQESWGEELAHADDADHDKNVKGECKLIMLMMLIMIRL